MMRRQNQQKQQRTFTLQGCSFGDEDTLGTSVLLGVGTELAAELLAIESNIDPYSSFILSNNVPFDSPSIFLLKIAICTKSPKSQLST